MAKETKEQRINREALEANERLFATANYRASIPGRLMVAQALAQEVGITTDIRLTETGPSVRFYDIHNELLNETMCYTSEEWELEYLERRLREIKAEKDGKAARRTIAEDVWNRILTDSERVAIKENIHYLK